MELFSLSSPPEHSRAGHAERGRLITLPLEYIMGETGEMYLAGDDGYMRQRSRFVEEPTILQKEADTEATRDA